MSKAFLFKGSSSTRAFAVIGASYPEGGVCTCTNGTRTLKAKDTSGKAIFYIPSAGTWTVSVTLNGNTMTKSVEVSYANQCEKIWVMFYLFHDGEDNTEVTGGWDIEEFASISYVDDMMKIAITNWFSGIVNTKNKIDITSFENLKMKIYNASQYVTAMRIAFNKTKSTEGVTWNDLSVGENTINVPDEKGEYYIFIKLEVSNTPGEYFNIEEIMLE